MKETGRVFYWQKDMAMRELVLVTKILRDK